MKSLGLLLLGAWIAGSLIVFFVATQNFREVDRVLAVPAAPSAPAIPPVLLRPVLRHLSSELNRTYFFAWGIAQIVLGMALTILLAGRRAEMPISAAMLAIVTGLLILVTPEITATGRALDFVPRNPLPPEYAATMAAFWRLHAAYTGLDSVKILLGFALAWRLTRD
jgi:uncharacterized integral membrane protein